MSIEIEIRDLLKEMCGHLAYQSKLLEEMFVKGDETRNSSQQATMQMVEMLRSQFFTHPSFQQNPEILKKMEGILSNLPGGKSNDH